MKVAALIALVLVLFVAQPSALARQVAGALRRAAERTVAQPFRAANGIAVADLDRDVRALLTREMAAHLADIHQLNPPQTRVVGALTTGEYTWGTFMRALAVYGELSGASMLAGRDIARQLGDIGLVEFRLGGTRFSQLYASLSLRSYGVDLSTNRIWQSLSPEERTQWATLLDATKFYDPVKQQVINLPENYLGVAARIAAMSFEMGFLKDRALLDGLLDRAAVQFTSGALFADDALPTGRYDRYSNEYARYLWDAAQIAGRKDLLDALRPTLKTQMKLWWDLVAADGYGYPWGRSLGLVSYLDTLEIPVSSRSTPSSGRRHSNSSPPSTTAWQWLRKDFKDDRHLLSLFDFGRGNFSYISIDREWQQTTGALGKLADAHMRLMKGITAERVTAIPDAPSLPAVARFEFFKSTARQAGVWLVRQEHARFALPFTTATRPGVADYLPAPHGLPGFAAPVEQLVPALVPFLELEDGRTIVAADGADAIVPSANGRGVRAHWNQWAVVGGKAGERADAVLQSDVEWTLDGDTAVRTERLTAARPLRIKRWRVSVTTTGTRATTSSQGGIRTDVFDGPDGRLAVSVPRIDWPSTWTLRATGNAADGRGARGAIPLHLEIESPNLSLQPGLPQSWILRLSSRRP